MGTGASKSQAFPGRHPPRLQCLARTACILAFHSNRRWYVESLTRDRKLRLLYLQPGRLDDPVVGELRCVEVKDRTRYDALSYSWGDRGHDDWFEIEVDDRLGFAVSINVWIALRRLRSRNAVRVVCIDALCINRVDVKERNAQVLMMGSTFSKARCVIAWLGDDSRSTPDASMEEAQLTTANRVLRKIGRAGQESPKAWWNRLWVAQEVALAKEIVVYFGEDVIPWRDFFAAAESQEGWSAIENLQNIRGNKQSRAREEIVTLEDVLKLTGNYYASDPLDYVFGVAGLVEGQEAYDEKGNKLQYSLIPYGLSPDYSMSVPDLLANLGHQVEVQLTSRWISSLSPRVQVYDKLLVWAAACGHMPIAALLIDLDLITFTTTNVSLVLAARNGQNTIITMLLGTGRTRVSVKDPDERTPLSWAAANGHERTVRLLVDKFQANVVVADLLDRTPLAWAVGRGRDMVVELLLDRHQDVNTSVSIGNTLLGWAVRARSLGTVRFLLDHGAKIEQTDEDGLTPLWWADATNQAQMAQLLRDRGAKGPTNFQIEDLPSTMFWADASVTDDWMLL